MTLHGKFIWNELLTDDVEKAKAFYGELCGWSFDEMPMEGGASYYVAKRGEEQMAGLMDKSAVVPPQVPSHWFAYIAVKDVDKSTALVAASGGQVMRAPFDIPGIGRIAVVADPVGAPFGMITPVMDATA